MNAPLLGFRVSDPQIPGDVGDQLVPFNATRLMFELWHGAGVALPPGEIKLIFEQKAGLAGESWRAFPIAGELSSTVGLVRFVSNAWPEQITRRDEPGYFSYRLRARFSLAGEISEHLVPFGRQGLPAYVEGIHIYDADRPAEASENSTVPGSVRRLGTDFVVQSPLDEIDARVYLRKYRSNRPVLWEKRLRLRTRVPVTLTIDPLPPEVVPAPDVNTTNYYNLSFELSAEGASAFVSRTFLVGPVIPPGELSITRLGLSDHPLFEFDATALRYSDIWDRAVASVEVATTGYDPLADPTPATATLFFVDHGPSGERWSASAPIQFEADGTGWAYIDNPFLPPLDLDGAKQLHLVVNHNNRTAMLREDDLPFDTGFRHDRIVDVRSARVVHPDGTENAVIRRDSHRFKVDLKLFRSAEGPPVMLALVLRAQYRSRSYRRVASMSRTAAFRVVPSAGMGVDDLTLDFEIPALAEELFGFGAVAASIVVSYRSAGFRHARLYDAAEFAIDDNARGLLFEPLSVLGTRSPKPSIKPERLSGKHWCAKFPTSASTATLKQPFRKNIQAFISMLETNGATVKINATYRPPERAYLMQWAYKIAKKGHSAARVPKYVGVDIVWDHNKALAAAEEMVAGYDIVHEPAGPTSKHCTGHAIDMRITNLPSKLKFKVGSEDKTFDIGKAAAASNRELWEIASKYFSVVKLPKDPPHWYAL